MRHGQMNEINKKLGKRVCELRAIANFTQVQLANRADIAVEVVGRLERGENLPSLSKLFSIANSLGVELWQLFQFEKQSTAHERALQRLCAVMQSRSESEVLMLADVASRMFQE